MKKISIPFFFLSVFYLFGMTASCYAFECLQKSPTIAGGKDPYSPISTRKLAKGEYEDIKALLNGLVGRWHGHSYEKYCNIKELSDQTIKKYDINAKVKMNHAGDFFIKIEFYSAKERTTHQKIFRFYLNDLRLRIHNDDSTGDVEFIGGIGKHKIEMLYRLLHRNINNTGILHKEYFVTLSAKERFFSINQNVYTQGRLTEEHQWNFDRK